MAAACGHTRLRECDLSRETALRHRATIRRWFAAMTKATRDKGFWFLAEFLAESKSVESESVDECADG